MPGTPSSAPPFALRDLEWVITSPFLLTDRPEPNLADHPETGALLDRLTADPAPLLDHLAAASRLNLGRYFEQLVIFWLGNLPSVEIIGSNIRIYREKRSLGELDLVFIHGGKAYHWELAIKYYLNIGSGRKEADFVGPRRQDTLARKLGRMYDHQLALPMRSETRDVLDGLGIGDITSHPWVKGCLFHPLDDGARQVPARIAKSSLSGDWLTIGDLKGNRLSDFNRFLRLEKKRWITPGFYLEETETGGSNELAGLLERQFRSHPAPELVALFEPGDKAFLDNASRYFIAPDGWPTSPRKADNSQEAGD
ncbi:MAG: DUF1853 family protein [Sneathiella sp.]